MGVWISPVYLENLILNWVNRSQGRSMEFTAFDKFISLWIAFNAWVTYKSNSDRDIDMIEWVKKKSELPNMFKNLIESNKVFVSDLQSLKAKCPVIDMRPRRKAKKKSINDIKNFNEVIDVIYQIRCNLFHGQKGADEQRDLELVDLAFRVLTEIFGRPIVEGGISYG